jgi:hypothetical protein
MQVAPATHPTWAALLTETTGPQPTFVAARLFLIRARLEVKGSGNSLRTISKCAAELRELYAKNTASPTAQKDLSTLFG